MGDPPEPPGGRHHRLTPMVVWLAIAALVLVALAGRVQTVVLRRRLATSTRVTPIDPPTGMFSIVASPRRLRMERLRAERLEARQAVLLGTVVDGDPDQLGRQLNESLPATVVGLRLSQASFCLVQTLGEQGDDLQAPADGWSWRQQTLAPRDELPDWLATAAPVES